MTGNNVKEIVVLSGKGGVGKTSIVASFAALAQNAVFADCDVDAADLYLILKPIIEQKEDFSGGFIARILPEQCTNCGICYDLCRFDAIIHHQPTDDPTDCLYSVDTLGCEGCNVCAHFCPEKTIVMEKQVNGEWYISQTRFGPMVHARLGIAEENSGKLVTLVRSAARKLATEKGLDTIIVDGSPGIGCPVISSLTGVDMALVITEPSVSGIHDMKRVGELTRHFNIPAYVCINKWDINAELSDQIYSEAEEEKMEVIGKIQYDSTFTKAQVEGVSVLEFSKSTVATEIQHLWNQVISKLKN